MPIKNRLAELHGDIAAWRRDIHTHPELRFEEPRTAAFVAEKPRCFRCDDVVEGIGGTGVVGAIRGEATGADYASKTPGAMHARGHDGHTSMLLSAARYLAESRRFDGTVVVIFQPTEEDSGGAKATIDDGLSDRWGIDEVYGLHNWPGIAPGQFAGRAGPQMAAVDFFEIAVGGRGGHAALPHLTVAPTLAASRVAVALQSAVARIIDPLETAVLSICGLRSDTHTVNVIPASATLRGTVRYLEPSAQATIRGRMEATVLDTARAYGAEAEIVYSERTRPTIDTPDAADWAVEATAAVFGDAIRDLDPAIPGEDFLDMLALRPGACVFIGNGDSADLHNPKYDFNDQIVPAGCCWFAETGETRMPMPAARSRKGAQRCL